MSEVTDATTELSNHPEGVLNGTVGKHPEEVETVDVGDDDDHVPGEESDDYEEEDDVDYEEQKQVVGDEDDEDEEGEGEEVEDDGEEEEAEGRQNGLTHLLLGNPNGPVDGDDLGDEEDEEDEDEDDDYTEEPAPPANVTKKRTIDEVADDDEAQGTKKVKA